MRYLAIRATEPHTLRLRPRQTSPDSFLDARPLELAHGGEDLELKDPGRSPKIDTFVDGHEPDTDRVQFFEQEHEVTQAPPYAIEPPRKHDIESPASSILA